MANRTRKRTQKKQRKRRGGMTDKIKYKFSNSTSSDTLTDTEASHPTLSSVELAKLIRELPPPKYTRPRSTRRLPNVHCDEEINQEKTKWKNIIGEVVKIASDECSKEIAENNKNWEKRMNKQKTLIRRMPYSKKTPNFKQPPNYKKQWRPAGPVKYKY
jgi:hypothetical protein